MFEAANYGQTWADIYDHYPAHPTAADAEPAADMLATLAAGRPVLEFGIGTGRIALPLAARGVPVTGIDASAAMLARLADKPDSGQIEVTIGDFTKDRLDKRFGVVFGAFNTVLMLTTQEEQVACFENAAAHLVPDGYFVVEAFIPEFTKLATTSGFTVQHVDDEGVWMFITRHDALHQMIYSDTVRVGPAGMIRYPNSIRYAWPAELDLMARLAGFRLQERYEDWQHTPFSGAARNHVSVYRLTD